MARTYRRSANGRFAGGSGGSSGGSAGKKPPQRKATPAKKKAGRGVRAYRKTVKFVQKNPRLVAAGIYAVGYGAAAGSVGVRRAREKKAIKAQHAAGQAQQAYYRSRVSDRVGLGVKPGTGLKMAKKSLRGTYKIRS